MPTPTSLALPDSEIANAAVALNLARVPQVIHDHCVRSYLYARELARQEDLRPGRDYDDELLFLCTLLHDLGLTSTEESDKRFEVHGADQAVTFAREAGLAADKQSVLWDAIALHTSNGIADQKQAEVALTSVGVAVDIVGGPARERLPVDLVASVHEHHPRQDAGYALTEMIAHGTLRRTSKATPFSFPEHVLHLWSPVGSTTSFVDLLAVAGWGDRPTGGFTAVGTDRPERLADEFVRRLADRGVDGLLALYDADAVFVSGQGVVARGHEEIRPALAAMVDAGAAMELTLENIHVAGDQALMTNRATVLTPGAGESLEVSTTEVARRRRDGRWVYVIDDPFFVATPAERTT